MQISQVNEPVLVYTVTDVSITTEKLTGSLACFDSVITISPGDSGISINVVVCLSGPKEEGDFFYNIISLSKEVAGFNFSKQYDFEIELNPEHADWLQNTIKKLFTLL